MNRLVNDVRYGFRMLRNTPSATAMVLIALSLGIGLSALMFSLINGAVLATLPVDGGDRVVMMGRTDPLARTADDYTTWVARQRSFEHLGALSPNTVTFAIEGSSTTPVQGASITPSVLRIVSTSPAIGRPFTDQDAAPGASAVVLISNDLWRDRLGADPNAVGRVVRVNGRPTEIIGVMPTGFRFPWDQDVWEPVAMDPVRGGAQFAVAAEGRLIIGRLRDGVSAQDAARELTGLTRELETEKRGTTGPASMVGVRRYADILGGEGQSVMLAGVLLGVALLVLLVACSNVANVLLARAVARQREIVIRLAVGASRLRIATQLLVETSLLAVGGAVGGVAIALVGTRQIAAITPPGMPYWIAYRVDWPVLGFIAIVAVLATIMAGLVPAIQASRANTHELLKSDGRGISSFHLGRVMRRLVGVEIALSFVLLVLAGLFIRSGANVSNTDFAFEPEGVYSGYAGLPEAGYEDPASRTRFADRLSETLGALPSVTGIALSTDVPGVGSSRVVPVVAEGAAEAGANGKGALQTR